jgi:hypothetical protein
MPLSAIAPDTQILHIKSPTFPQFRFEWHPKVKRVYVVRIGMTPEIGEPIAFEITTHGDAYNAVAIWLRGYKQAQLELSEPTAILQTT